MQCPSCEFQNMPGSGRCARCGASLALASAAIDVIPPRAGKLQRNLPQFWGFRRAWANFIQAASQPFAATFSRFDDVRFDPGTVFRLIVPGWAQVYRGKRERGLLFLAAYLITVLPALLFTGTMLGSSLLGLAFGIHVMSAVDAMVGRFNDFAGRVSFSLFAAMALFGLVYLPIGYVTTRVATPIQITQLVPGFERGDVLWYDRSAEIKAGDLVYYEVPRTTVSDRLASGQVANFIFQNGWINRVVAVEGQSVLWRDGKLLVDGEPALGSNSTLAPDGFTQEFVVPAGNVLIPPGTLIQADVQLPADTWLRLGVVPRSDVMGRLFFRSSPLRRISFIE
jgi:type IV secretory pathway protease TraF